MVWIIHSRACSPAICLPDTWASFFRILALSSFKLQAPDTDAGNDPNSVDHVRSMSELRCAASSIAGDGKKMGCVQHQLTAGSAIAHLHSPIFRPPFATLETTDLTSASSSPGLGEVMRFLPAVPPTALIRECLSLLLFWHCVLKNSRNSQPTCILLTPRGTVCPPSPPPHPPRSRNPSEGPPSTSGL